jgi:hypothetical protein
LLQRIFASAMGAKATNVRAAINQNRQTFADPIIVFHNGNLDGHSFMVLAEIRQQIQSMILA